MNIRIDSEFQSKIPMLTNEEFKQLEENIINDGEVREPLVVWENEGIIVDGHNRWKIISAHPEIRYKIKEMYFKDKWEAFDWMYKNQLGRRNLTEAQRTYLIGKLYEARKHTQGGTGANQYTVQTAEKRLTAKGRDGTSIIIAKEQGIGKTKVKDSYHYAKGIDTIREANKEVADSILNGKVSVTKKEIINIQKAEPDKLNQFIEDVKNEVPRQKKKSEEKEQLKFIKAAAEEMRKPVIHTLTIDDLIRDLKNNSIPFIRLLNQIVNEYSEIIPGNENIIISVIEENIENEIIKLKEKFKQ